MSSPMGCFTIRHVALSMFCILSAKQVRCQGTALLSGQVCIWQALLSQAFDLRALWLLHRFWCLGSWAAGVALSRGAS